MAWYEKINRLEELEDIFLEFISEDIFKKIQYISLRKSTYKNYILLVGVNDLDAEHELLNHAPQIVKKTKELQEQKEDIHEQKLLPKKMEVFKYDIKKKEERKELERKWHSNPISVLKTTDKANCADEDKLIYNGKIYPLEKSWRRYENTILGNIHLNNYDFEVIDRYGETWRYGFVNKLYYKYKTKDKIEMYVTPKIGVYRLLGNYTETTKQTYNKWLDVSKKG